MPIFSSNFFPSTLSSPSYILPNPVYFVYFDITPPNIDTYKNAKHNLHLGDKITFSFSEKSKDMKDFINKKTSKPPFCWFAYFNYAIVSIYWHGLTDRPK